MSASGSTTNYNLPIYAPDDITSWLIDFNGAMEKIDANIYEVSQSSGSSINVVQTTGTSTTDVMSQKAVTDQLAAKADTSAIPTMPNVLQGTGQSETDVMSQKAVSDAINPLNLNLNVNDYFQVTTTQSQVTIANKILTACKTSLNRIHVTGVIMAQSESRSVTPVITISPSSSIEFTSVMGHCVIYNDGYPNASGNESTLINKSLHQDNTGNIEIMGLSLMSTSMANYFYIDLYLGYNQLTS